MHLWDSADKVIQGLLDTGIIVPVHGPTECTSQGHFVVKPDGSARQVTYYTQLNKFVKWPVHPFPSSQNIAQHISPDSKVFAMFDCKFVYHQFKRAHKSMGVNSADVLIKSSVGLLIPGNWLMTFSFKLWTWRYSSDTSGNSWTGIGTCHDHLDKEDKNRGKLLNLLVILFHRMAFHLAPQAWDCITKSAIHYNFQLCELPLWPNTLNKTYCGCISSQWPGISFTSM